MSKVLDRRSFLKSAALSAVGVGAVLAGCAPKVVEVTRVVKEKEVVKETVVVTQQKEVEKIVKQTVVMEKVKEMVLIRMHSRLGDAKRKVYEESIKRFQEANPQAKVNIEEFPAGSAEYGPKIAALVAGGAVGDLTWNAIGTGSFQFLASNKALAALDEMVAADKTIKLDDWYPRVIKGFRMGPGGQGTGELYGLPTDSHGVNVLLYFNRDLIEKEGQKPPTDDWTLDDLVQFGLKMTKEGRFGYAPVVGDYSNMRNHTLRFGGEIVNADSVQVYRFLDIGTAKPTPTDPRMGLSMEEMTPTASPWALSSGPPEFPGFTAASVWIMLRMGRCWASARTRPSELTMPSVMLRSRPNGLPMAMAR